MSIQITGGAASAPAATTSLSGIVELATTTEAAAGTDTVRAVTPEGLALRKIGDGWALGSGGNSRGADAVDLQTVRSDSTQVASGYRSTVGGGQGNTASGYYATVGGGQGNTASGNQATVGGGQGNTASGNQATVGGGQGNTASGYYATIGGGQGAKTNKYGQNAFASGTFASAGDAQTSVLVARAATTTATPTPLFLDGASEKLTIAADTTWAFTAVVVARRTDADNESAAYRFEGCIDRNAGTTALVGTVTKTVIAEDSAGWDCNVTADDTNDALIITATGEAGKTIRWVARIELVEVTG